MEKRVDEYIDKQKHPLKEILQKVREIFHATLSNCEEKMSGVCQHLPLANSILQQ
jgi:hypothetical protein